MAQVSSKTEEKFSQGAQTGASNVTFDLVSLLYHTLKGAEVYPQYLQDAEEATDQELAQFLRDCQQQDKLRAERSKALLRHRLAREEVRHDTIEERSLESFPASDPPAR